MGGTLIQEVFVAQDVLEIMKIPLLKELPSQKCIHSFVDILI
jgi:hypothetical protein